MDQWIPRMRIEARPASKILSDTVLSIKLYDSSAEYKDQIAVSKIHEFVCFLQIYYFAMGICHHCAYTACTRIESTVLSVYLLHKQITRLNCTGCPGE